MAKGKMPPQLLEYFKNKNKKKDDGSGEKMSDKEKMKEAYQSTPNEQMRSQSYIYSPLKGGVKNWMNINDWFATHPSLKERLEMLGEASSND